MTRGNAHRYLLTADGFGLIAALLGQPVEQEQEAA